MKYHNKFVSYLYILPSFLLVFLLLLVPMFQNIYYSFFQWNGIAEPIFNGFSNYIQLFKDSNFFTSLINTVLWVVITLIFPVFGGLLIAVFLRGIKFGNFFKSIFYIPITISFVATGIIWNYMYSRQIGVLNTFLDLIGVNKISWLVNVPLNTFSLLITWTWQQLGINMVLFLMGLTSIPVEQTEAATIEGASKWQTFIHVTFPMLRPITTVVIVMATANSFKVFDLIYVMTRGGPYRSSETLAVTMFRETFTMSNMGYGAAISVVLSIIVVAISAIYLRTMVKKDLLYY
ncbi:MAG TPA: sugar ABC transporter permease [Actinobacteria bacterium]|jgi:ABC-type sugar transport system permease subunit|nr:sugar ABC transporter permease [Actinomycetota bacterium]